MYADSVFADYRRHYISTCTTCTNRLIEIKVSFTFWNQFNSINKLLKTSKKIFIDLNPAHSCVFANIVRWIFKCLTKYISYQILKKNRNVDFISINLFISKSHRVIIFLFNHNIYIHLYTNHFTLDTERVNIETSQPLFAKINSKIYFWKQYLKGLFFYWNLRISSLFVK